MHFILPNPPRHVPRTIGLMSIAVVVLLVITNLSTCDAYADEIDEKPITEADLGHWAFQPPVRSEPPAVRAADRVRNPVDRFILTRLEAAGIGLSPEADRVTLIRRVAFDLTGLPPTPEQVERFLSDESADAYERLVDRLLASPAYGERWAQHWLDLARFAESDGFEHDIVRPDAWQYRDWVIDALNADMPYQQFLRLQIAGDEIASEDDSAAIGTGFLLAGPDMPDINLQEERRHTKLNEMTATVGEVFMGLRVGCAQCHDHPSDPFSQADFYRLRAFFANTVFPERDKPLGYVIAEPGNSAPESRLIIRGDFKRPGPILQPAFPRVLNPDNRQPSIDSSITESTGRRAALADWLTSGDNPLTSRVIVNRLWQHHFGRGLVETASDFGPVGQPPSHPALLDYLAVELDKQHGSLKAMHRLMLTSATYRQASRPTESDLQDADPVWKNAKQIDPDNKLLWRMNRIRLEGEAIRDAMLAASDQLNGRAGGPGVRPPLPEEITATLLNNQWAVTEDHSEHDRRSVYIFARRNLRYPFFQTFDRPSADAPCPRRSQTTTPTQSLVLLNSQFSLDTARQLAQYIRKHTVDDADAQITLAYQRTVSRNPTEVELSTARDFLNQQTQLGGEAEGGAVDALTDLALALFNLNEFIYLD